MDMVLSKDAIFGSRLSSRLQMKRDKRERIKTRPGRRVCPNGKCPHCKSNKLHSTRVRMMVDMD